jgi:Mg-chelatase subunit ChlD
LLLNSNRGSNVPRAIIVITDGVPNLPANESVGFIEMVKSANAAKGNGTIIYAIGVGSGTQTLTLNAMARYH